MNAIRPPKRFDDALARRGDRAGEPERGHVDEVAHRLAAVVGAVADAAGVDHARGASRMWRGGGADLLGQLQRAAKIAARAARDEADLGGGRPRRPRSTPSATSEIVPSPPSARISRRPAAASRARDLGRVARPGRERAVDLAQPIGERAADARPARLGQPATRARVDDDEGAARIQGETTSNRRTAARHRYPPAPMSPVCSSVSAPASAGRWRTSPCSAPGPAWARFAACCGRRCAGVAMVAASLSARSDQRAASPPSPALGPAGSAGRVAGVRAAGLRLPVLRVRARPPDVAVPIMSSWAVIAAALSSGVFDQRLGAGQLAGGAAVIAGALVVSRYAQKEGPPAAATAPRAALAARRPRRRRRLRHADPGDGAPDARVRQHRRDRRRLRR